MELGILYLDRQTATQNAGDSLIDRFKADTRIEDLLIQYGYIKLSADEYQSPNSHSGHVCKISKDQDMIISLSTSDADVGRELNGSWCADAFDLFKFYEHGNDVKAAIETLEVQYPLERPTPVKDEQDFKKQGSHVGNNNISGAKHTFDDLFPKLSEIDPTPPTPLIEGIIFAESLISVTGVSGSGKNHSSLRCCIIYCSRLGLSRTINKTGQSRACYR